MNTKGFADSNANIETPNDMSGTEKPLNTEVKTSGRVDINVLKSKLQETESKEFKKNSNLHTTKNICYCKVLDRFKFLKLKIFNTNCLTHRL